MRQLNVKAKVAALILVSALGLAACDTGGPAASNTPTTAPTSVALATQPQATSDVPVATKAPTSEAVSSQQPLGEWYLVDSNQGGFSVQMPLKPNEGTSPITDNSGNTIDLHTFVASRTSAEYTMTYADYPDQVAAIGAEAMLNNTLTGALGKNTAIDKKNITVGGSPGMEVEFVDEASQNYAWYMSVARGNRIYQLIVVATGKDSPDADARRFFDSLTLTQAISESTPQPTEGVATRTTDSSGGQVYTSSEGGFTVEMPGAPEARTQSVDAGGGTIEVNTLSLSAAQASYTLTYSDLPETSMQSGPAALLEGTLGGVLGQQTLLDRRDITVQGNPGIEGDFEVQGTGYVRFRGILVGQRLFQLIIITPDRETNAAAAQQYFDSFKLTR